MLIKFQIQDKNFNLPALTRWYFNHLGLIPALPRYFRGDLLIKLHYNCSLHYSLGNLRFIILIVKRCLSWLAFAFHDRINLENP